MVYKVERTKLLKNLCTYYFIHYIFFSCQSAVERLNTTCTGFSEDWLAKVHSRAKKFSALNRSRFGQVSDLAPFLSQSEKLSEIKPPLAVTIWRQIDKFEVQINEGEWTYTLVYSAHELNVQGF